MPSFASRGPRLSRRDSRTSTIVTEGGAGALGGLGVAGAEGAGGGGGTPRGRCWSSLSNFLSASEMDAGNEGSTGRAAEKAAHARVVMTAREGKYIVFKKEWKGGNGGS